MAYSEKRKQYARDWYAKNKDRLKALSHRKEAKRISDRKYYIKNIAHLKEKSRQWRLENLERNSITKKKYYSKNRDRFIALQRQKRETAAYKIYMREYRKLNKEKLSAQERIANRRWVKKQVDAVSDSYIINLLCNQKVGIFKTHAEAKEHPELIELRKTQILLKRIKQKIKKCDPKRSS